MHERADFFQKKLSNTRSLKRKSSGYPIWIVIIILILLGGGYALYQLFFASPNLSPSVEDQTSAFSLGQEITLHGELKADGDIITHTHTIADEVHGILSVKSKSLNLGEYVGIVDATGVVEKFYQNSPIVEIIALSGQQSGVPSEETIDIVLDKASGVYLLEAGMHFLPAFFEEYLLLNEGENGQILIQDLETDQEIAINYFRCNVANPNRNCKGLVDTFSQTSARSFVTANGDTYYKQSEVNSRFIANGDRWGVFINDVPEDTIMKLKDLIVFANAHVMKNWMDFSALRICQNADEKLQKITSSNITLKQEGLIAEIKGQGATHTLECSVLVDFSLPAKGALLSLTQGNLIGTGDVVADTPVKSTSSTGQQEKEPETILPITPLPRDPQVAQFPLNSEKGLSYTSSRGGYALKFPSANISYAVSSVKENFGQANLFCSYVINVTKYADKDTLEISPAIRIYECEANGAITSPGEHYLLTEGASKTFVIQINDPAWIEFSNALAFTTT